MQFDIGLLNNFSPFRGIVGIETVGGQKINPARIEIKGKKRDAGNTKEIYSFSLGKGVTIRL